MASDDVPLDEALETAAAILEGTNQACIEFVHSMTNWKSTYAELADRMKQQDEMQKKLEDAIKAEQQRQDEIIKSIYASRDEVELVESGINAMRETEALKQCECLSLEEKIADMKRKNNNFEQHIEDIRSKRNEILVCKLLSNIEFVYSTKRISGVVNKDDPVAFDLKPENMTQEEITEALWDLALKE